jgi:hypothetical protein
LSATTLDVASLILLPAILGKLQMSLTPEKQREAMSLARSFGFNLSQLEKFADVLGAGADVADRAVPEVETVAATLRGVHGLSPAQRENVMRALAKDGHISGDLTNRAMFASAERPGVEVRTPIEAMSASANNGELVRNLKARCRRFGFDMKLDEKIDPFHLNDQLTKAGVSTEERVALKSHMAQLKLLA